MRKTGFPFVIFLAGCATLTPALDRKVDLLVYPRFAQNTQSIINSNTIASIATLDIVPYIEVTTNNFSPISSTTGNPTTLGASDMLKLSQASPTIDPDRPFRINKLKPGKNYRVYGRAYASSNAQISQDSTSYVDVAVGNNDAPSMATLPVNLLATPFGATISVSVSTEGRYDYLKRTLYLVSGQTQTVVAQSTLRNPELTFSNLQGNTSYRLLVEAYKLGGMLASKSLDFSITNESAPTSLSMALTVPYVVKTLAGDGVAGFADGASARFNALHGVAADLQGNVYTVDWNNQRVRKISPTGVVSTLAGNGTAGHTEGIGNQATFNGPCGVACDAAGNLYVADHNNNCIRKVLPDGTVSTLAGSGIPGWQDASGTSAMFNLPTGVAVDALGNVYVADKGNQRIRKITAAGVVTTLAGNGTAGFSEGTGSQAKFDRPEGVTVDPQGNVYVADWNNQRVRKINTSNVVTTFAGNGTAGYADGTGSQATFNGPDGVGVDLDGNIYVADRYNNRIRKITPSGVVSTLAGTGATGLSDGTGALASFNNPYTLTSDIMGNLYVGDEINNCIRKMQ